MEFYSRDCTTVEKIGDAGLTSANARGYGYVNRIRLIGAHLYVCGVAGQIYRRSAPGQWMHHDSGVLQPLASLEAAMRQLQQGASGDVLDGVPPVLDLMDIAGMSEVDMYAVGSHGAVLHRSRHGWRRLDVGIDDDLTAIHCESDSEVWICGANGYVLVGNARDGFRNLSAVDDNQTFRSITKYRGVVYLAADAGLFAFDGGSFKAIRTGLKPEVSGLHKVEATPGTLWCFGAKDFAYLAEGQWTRVRHPDNPHV